MSLLEFEKQIDIAKIEVKYQVSESLETIITDLDNMDWDTAQKVITLQLEYADELVKNALYLRSSLREYEGAREKAVNFMVSSYGRFNGREYE